jgi:hypothetical protein
LVKLEISGFDTPHHDILATGVELDKIMTETTFTQEVPALPAWRVIWEMMRFHLWLWFADLLCVALIRFCWQVAPALIIKSLFDMLTGDAPLTFGMWTIVALAVAAWLGRVAPRTASI